jgi:electron transfer flavoprotein beta subunit
MVLRVRLPAVLTIAGTSYVPRIPTLRDVLAARRKTITVWSIDDVGIDPSRVGLLGSPLGLSGCGLLRSGGGVG